MKVLHVIARMNVGGTARYVGDLVAENLVDTRHFSQLDLFKDLKLKMIASRASR